MNQSVKEHDDRKEVAHRVTVQDARTEGRCVASDLCRRDGLATLSRMTGSRHRCIVWLPVARLGLALGLLLLLAGSCQKKPPVARIPSLTLSEAQASSLLRLSMDCVDKPWPNKPGHILDGDETLKPPSVLTPAFYGCFDWHSAVHGHWAMVRVLALFPSLPESSELRVKLSAHLQPDRIAQEVAFFSASRNRTFERPYGIGWLLRLSAELHSLAQRDEDAKRWLLALRPLTELLAQRLSEYLSRLTVPVRSGTHDNTAYAMIHALDYAQATQHEAFARLLMERALTFYQADRRCPVAYEPSGEDFISPCLVEADLMRRVMTQSDFARWLQDFLPAVDSPAFDRLRAPVEVRDLRDPRIGHLIGLSFQRAAALRGLAKALSAQPDTAQKLSQIADKHTQTALAQIKESGYGGTHWLASFALYLLTNVGL